MYTQSEDFIINNISYKYKNLQNNQSVLNEIVNNTNFYLELDLTPIFDTYSNNVDILYKIRDDANNINIIPRRITVEQSNLIPIFKYYNLVLDDFNIQNIPLIIQSNIILTQDILRNRITAIDPDNSLQTIENYISEIVNSNLIINSINYEGTYTNAIKYKAIGRRGRERTLYRTIIIQEHIPSEVSEPDIEYIKQCCYPQVYYKPIQHNYKLGSQSATINRISKIIINNIR